MATSVMGGDSSGLMERLRHVEAQSKQNTADIRDIKDNNQQAVLIERLASAAAQLEDLKKEVKLLRQVLLSVAALAPIGIGVVTAVLK